MIWMTTPFIVKNFSKSAMDKKIMILAGLMSMSVACSVKQEFDPLPSSDDKVYITASFPEMTKVTFSDVGDALDLVWDEDDYITVVSGKVSEKYEIVSYEGNVATFAGKSVHGDSYDIILSYSGDEYLHRSYHGQTQSTVASVDHLKYDAVLKGVSDYNDIRFTSAWAEEHGGVLIQNGCLLLHFQMPEDAGHIKTVTLSAEDEIFYATNSADGERTNELSIIMNNADMQDDNVIKAYIMTSMQEANIPAETELTLTVVSNLGTWSKKFIPGESKLEAGKKNIIKLNSRNWTVPAGVGTESDPYILRTAEDLRLMASKLGSEKKYVAMVNDIDASAISTWPSISYNKSLDFNGNNRTISNFSPATFSNEYAGFVAILNGRIANLSIIDAKITGAEGKACGILCGYLGRSNAQNFGEIENVHVEGVVNGKANGVGGLVGILGSGTIQRCSADVEVYNNKDNTTSGYRTGGLVGYYNDGSTTNVCEISDCWTAGIIKGGMQKTGGIIGEVFGNSSYENTNPLTIQNCYSTASVEGMRVVGGIVGYAGSKEPTSVMKCIAWNEMIKATGTNHNQYSSGAVVARTYVFHTLKDCYRIPDINFSCMFQDIEGVEAYVCDQDNADSNNKLIVGTYGEDGSIYKENECSNWYPYHGKTAMAGVTLSSVARSLKWDETIWDLSSALPKLIR